jgi:hypothetical protein
MTPRIPAYLDRHAIWIPALAFVIGVTLPWVVLTNL